MDVFDAHRSERPRTAVIEEMIVDVQLLIEDDPHMTYQQTKCPLEISSMAGYSIVYNHLGLRKVLRSTGSASVHKRSKASTNSVLA